MINIHVVNSGNTISWNPTGDIVVGSNGNLTSYTVDKPRNKVKPNCDVENGWVENFYGSTRDCIDQHIATTLYNAGSPYAVDFTPDANQEPAGYYISEINGVPGKSGCFDIVNGPGIRWFPSSEGGITLALASRSCENCFDYIRAAGYIARINEMLDDTAVQITGTPSSNAANPQVYGLWKQYQAMRELWNYVVVKSTVVSGVEQQGRRIHVKARFTNPSVFTVPVGNLMISLWSSQYNALLYKAWGTSNNGGGQEWTTSNTKFQTLAAADPTGTWWLAPGTSVTIDAGGYYEVNAVFIVFNKTLISLSGRTAISRDIAPWADSAKRPAIASGKVTSAGWLSWERTHFNPSTYTDGSVPVGLPPTGDNCLMQRSPGTVSVAWNTAGSISSIRPKLHIDMYCLQDALQASFTSGFDMIVTPETTDPNGAFSMTGSGTTAKLQWTPTGGSAADILTFTMTNQHFHKGDHIYLDIPEGWDNGVTAPYVRSLCRWSIPANQCIPTPANGGEYHLCVTPPNPELDIRKIKSIVSRESAADYDTEKIRTIEISE